MQHALSRPGPIAFALLLASSPFHGALGADDVKADPDGDAIARGKYVAIAGDCAGCHTRDGGEAYAGGQAIESPLGTLYTANVTPDAETGIGSWTEEDFRRVLWHGRDDEGRYVYPAMPFDSYTKLSERDVADLWAYFRSLEPVSYTPPENDMVFPANIREGLALWQAVEFEPGRFVPEPGRSEEYNRGAYLVEGAGHCGACHTPRDILFGTDESRRYTGAEIHGWYAPAIGAGPLSEIGDWDTEELATFLATGTNDSNQKVVGEMTKVVHDSLARLEPEDVHAIATYLKEMPPPADTSTDTQGVTLSPARREAGRALYAAHCLSCHQGDGRGIENGVPSLVGNATVEGREANDLIMLVLEGHAPEGTWGAMPSFATTLSARHIADIANYVRTAWGNDGEPDVSPAKVGEVLQDATVPDGGQEPGVSCPILSGERMAPALAALPEVIDAHAPDPEQTAAMVERYREARADSSVEDIVLALSSAYCRKLAAAGDASLPEQQGQVAAFAGAVAEAAMPDAR